MDGVLGIEYIIQGIAYTKYNVYIDSFAAKKGMAGLSERQIQLSNCGFSHVTQHGRAVTLRIVKIVKIKIF